MPAKSSKGKVPATKAIDDEKWKKLNAEAGEPHEAAQKLYELIRGCISAAEEPALANVQIAREVIEDTLKNSIKIFPTFNEKYRIVEVWSTFWAYKEDGKLLWTLKVIWDADEPEDDENKPEDEKIRPHYGWEIYLDGKRVGGPGHVYFPPHTGDPAFYRKMNSRPKEEDTGRYQDQYWAGKVRIDWAARVRKLQAEEHEDQSLSEEEYERQRQRPPNAWNNFDLPSFGRG
ncbi:MAG: hypothetical protein Q9160_006135 [Pyrenula sp. 1 TL-2023]